MHPGMGSRVKRKMEAAAEGSEEVGGELEAGRYIGWYVRGNRHFWRDVRQWRNQWQ